MRYRRENGVEFILWRNPAETWADKVKTQLLDLGCSAEYAEKVAESYRKAEEVPVVYDW